MNKPEIIDILNKEITCRSAEALECIDTHCLKCPHYVDRKTLIGTYHTIIQILLKEETK